MKRVLFNPKIDTIIKSIKGRGTIFHYAMYKQKLYIPIFEKIRFNYKSCHYNDVRPNKKFKYHFESCRRQRLHISSSTCI